MKNQFYKGYQVHSVLHPLKRLRQIIKGAPHYKCRIKNKKCHIKILDDFLIVRRQNDVIKLPLKKIKQTALQEKMWEIRVKIKCEDKIYAFDFPSVRKATDFYEHIIFYKIKATSY